MSYDWENTRLPDNITHGKRKQPKPAIVVHIENPNRYSAATHDVCQHRPAYLVSGEIACGYCGIPL